MAMRLQRAFGLPVVAVRLGQVDGEPCADVRLVDNSGSQLEVIDQRTLSLDRFGCDDDQTAPRADLRIPEEVTGWVAEWVHQTLGPGAALWLHLVKPYGVLGAAPWEQFLQPAIGLPLVRLPDAMPDQDRSSSAFDVALVATAPAPEGGSTGYQLGPAVSRALAEGVGGRLRLHVFADVTVQDFLGEEVRKLPVREVEVHRYDGRGRDRTGDGSPDLRNGWLRWVRRSMAGRNLDAVHFLVHGDTVGQEGAILTPLEPGDRDRGFPVAVQVGELRTFLNQVGALVVGFSRPQDNWSDYGLRRLVDDLGSVRAAPVVLHDEKLDAGSVALRDCYAFLSSATPTLPPASPSLTLFAQPKMVYAGGSAELPTAPDTDLPQPTAAVSEHFSRDQTPMWLAAAERYIEQQQGDLLRYRQAIQNRRPTSSEQAYYSGVETALRKVREVVDRHAEGQL